MIVIACVSSPFPLVLAKREVKRWHLARLLPDASWAIRDWRLIDEWLATPLETEGLTSIDQLAAVQALGIGKILKAGKDNFWESSWEASERLAGR